MARRARPSLPRRGASPRVRRCNELDCRVARCSPVGSRPWSTKDVAEPRQFKTDPGRVGVTRVRVTPIPRSTRRPVRATAVPRSARPYSPAGEPLESEGAWRGLAASRQRPPIECAHRATFAIAAVSRLILMWAGVAKGRAPSSWSEIEAEPLPTEPGAWSSWAAFRARQPLPDTRTRTDRPHPLPLARCP
jgi:hypothetical protein